MKAAKSIGAFVVVWVIAYLTGSFIAASFDITQWDAEVGRPITGIFGTILAAVAAGITWAENA